MKSYISRKFPLETRSTAPIFVFRSDALSPTTVAFSKTRPVATSILPINEHRCHRIGCSLVSLRLIDVQCQFCVRLALAGGGDIKALQVGHEDGRFSAVRGWHFGDVLVVIRIALFKNRGGFAARHIDAVL